MNFDQILKVQSDKYAYWWLKKEYELVKTNFRFLFKASKKGIKKRKEMHNDKNAVLKLIDLSLIITLSIR
jgi:7-cyano-7-deazaguanine synthase in queuosine biosynthesis